MYKRLQLITVSQKKLWFLALIGIFFTLGLTLTLNRVPFIRYKSDLFLRWHATVKLFEEGRNLYDARNGEDISEIVYGGDLGYETNFYYPAFLIIFTGPLSLVSYPTAHFIWTTAVQLFYLIGLWRIIQEVGWPQQVNHITAFMLVCVLFVPYLQHTIWGQFNTIGMLSLAICWIMLRRSKYGLAGALATGMLIKPQSSILVLVFLFIWVIAKKPRWPFLIGFSITSFVLWLVPELIQPGWIFDFIKSLGGYVPTTSVLDQWWNPNQVLAVALTLGAIFLFLRLRNTSIDSPQFAASLGISLYLWALIVPIVGMFHILMFPITIIMLLSHLQHIYPRVYKVALACFGSIYILGWIGFIVGLFGAGLYGMHIIWSEMAYKAALPVISILFSLPLLMSPNENQLQKVQ
ncbi:MAG: glycosyltransferase family 87 protein [Candidatus Promineifilaceae bacterium]